ncbi:MAG: hypothetical protein QXU98_07840 [Candidatus Parvarchaeota archaeon]
MMISISNSIEIAFGLAFIAIMYDIAYHLKIINHELSDLSLNMNRVIESITNLTRGRFK